MSSMQPPQHSRRKPEVKSPAGHWPQLHAAIEAGADAVYFGLKHFTARAKAGFDLSELPEAMRTLHKRGVHGYVTFNTLLFEHELAEAARVIGAIAGAGADGMIVQDFTAVRLAHEIAPDLPLHGSTQMSITDARGVELARKLGVSRVTLARELSLEEVRKIIAETGGELEIFCHGALCVAYSGQCFSSEAWGGRSANRGQCAQACRLPYDLIVDGHKEPLGDARYLLSPGDLYALKQIPEIVEMGISALKIEGRYKDADYVALTTRAYRKAVDEAWEGRALSVTPQEELQLEQVYSRGLGPYFLSGTDHQAVVHGRAPRHRGVEVGRVVRVEPGSVLIETADANRISPIKAGDGLVFDAADWRSPEEREEGGRVYHAIAHLDGKVELRFANDAVAFDRIRKGDLVWRTHDPEIDRAVKPYLEASTPMAKQGVRVRVSAREGAPLVSEWYLIKDPRVTVRVESPQPLGQAQSRGLSKKFIEDQFSRLGNTAYELVGVELETEGLPFVPASLLNQLRRDAVVQLQNLQEASHPIRVRDAAPVLESLKSTDRSGSAEPSTAELHVMVRTPEQLDAAIAVQPSSITLDYLDLYGLRPSVEKVRASGIAVRVASPRILKPAEARIANFLLSLECPIVVRHSGLVYAWQNQDLQNQARAALIGDFSLNVASSITADLFLNMGLERITPTHDLNADQIATLARHTGPERIEVIAYQHLPVFHTEHCVFARFLSTGKSYRDCGRPCEKHRVELRDTSGRSHPVMADVGCRNTVFGAEAQEVGGHFDDWRASGIKHWRLEFVHESPAELTRVYRAFRDALDGKITARQLAAELKKAAPQGTTEGSLFVAPSYLKLPVLQ